MKMLLCWALRLQICKVGILVLIQREAERLAWRQATGEGQSRGLHPELWLLASSLYPIWACMLGGLPNGWGTVI